MAVNSSTCDVCHGAIPSGVKVEGHTALCAAVVGLELEQAMRAIAYHDGRSWCAVCGHHNDACAAATPDCLGARARAAYPRTSR